MRNWQTIRLLYLVAVCLAARQALLASAANVAGSSRGAIPSGWPNGIVTSCSDAFWAQQKLTLWKQVLDIVGVSKELCNPAARYLAFAPTNAALTAFMASMGFEQGISDLQQRPGLARELLAMHLVLALPPDAQQQLAKGRFAEVPTEAQGLFSRLKVKVTAGGVVVADGQGDAAHALKVLKLQENKTVVILDRVLFSGRYYTSFARLCNHRPPASDMCSALFKAGVLHSLATNDFASTVFVPGNKAFASAGIQLSALTDTSSHGSSAARAALVDRIRYHVVPGLHPIPGGFEGGMAQATLLQGRQLKVVYQPAGNGTQEAFVLADAGRQKVPVVVTDIYVGQAIAHGITSVLQPPPQAGAASSKPLPGTAATPTPTPPAAAAARNSKPAGPAAAAAAPKAGVSSSSSSAAAGLRSGRRLSAWSDIERVILPMNKAETDIRAKVHRMNKEQEEKW